MGKGEKVGRKNPHNFVYNWASKTLIRHCVLQ